MSDIKSLVENIKNSFNSDLESSGNLDELYLKYFSKKHGKITKLIKEIPNLDSESKKVAGSLINSLRIELEEKIKKARESKIHKDRNDPLIDLTYPLPSKQTGYLHPTRQVIREMDEFFKHYGFSIVDEKEIENEEFNFRRLNLPEGHPATDLQDTLYISEKDGILLRTHTSSTEARVLTNNKPPIRVAGAGKVFRNETASATNTSFFHQYQGFVVDEGINIQHLKSMLESFHKFLFGDDVVLRSRYKYYPEVSPGLGTDIKCRFCNGTGCEVCKYRGWIEVLGSGMIHYNTLKMCGIDPEKYTGFAFGMGLDRLVMAKFGISDARKLYGGEMIYK